jgi:hypothetical protein
MIRKVFKNFLIVVLTVGFVLAGNSEVVSSFQRTNLQAYEQLITQSLEEPFIDTVFKYAWEELYKGKKFSLTVDEIEDLIQANKDSLGITSYERYEDTLIWYNENISSPVLISPSHFFSVASSTKEMFDGSLLSEILEEASSELRNILSGRRQIQNSSLLFSTELHSDNSTYRKADLKENEGIKVLIISEFPPERGNFGETANPSGEVLSQFREEGIEVEMRGPNLELNDLIEMSDYDVVLMVGHGAPGVFDIGIPFDTINENDWEIDGKSTLVRLDEGSTGITSEFVENFSQIKNGSLIYLSACNSSTPDGNGNSLASAFEEKGAETVLGFDNIVPAKAAAFAAEIVVEDLLQGKNIEAAVAATTDVLDPTRWERRLLNLARETFGLPLFDGNFVVTGNPARGLSPTSLPTEATAVFPSPQEHMDRRIYYFERVPNLDRQIIQSADCNLCGFPEGRITFINPYLYNLEEDITSFFNAPFNVNGFGSVALENEVNCIEDKGVCFNFNFSRTYSGNSLRNPMVSDINADNVMDIIGVVFMSIGGGRTGQWYLFIRISQASDTENPGYQNIALPIDTDFGVSSIQVWPNHVGIDPKVLRPGENNPNFPSGVGERIFYRLFEESRS